MVDETASGVAARPRFDRRGLQIGDVVALDQRHALAGDPLLIHGLATALLRCCVEHKLTSSRASRLPRSRWGAAITLGATAAWWSTIDTRQRLSKGAHDARY